MRFLFRSTSPLPNPHLRLLVLSSDSLGFSFHRRFHLPFLQGHRPKLEMGQIQYSEKYFDDTYEYRYVRIIFISIISRFCLKESLLSDTSFFHPKLQSFSRRIVFCLRYSYFLPPLRCYYFVSFSTITKKIVCCRLFWCQSEWRAIGVQQSRGWVHYAIHRPEPHIMLYRRPLNYQQNQEAAAAAAAQQMPAK